MSQPDFAALRAARNARAKARLSKFAAENDIEESSLQSTFNPDACYCACSTGGPCEHTWDGPGYDSPDGCLSSATCSRCGALAMSHDMRFLP